MEIVYYISAFFVIEKKLLPFAEGTLILRPKLV